MLTSSDARLNPHFAVVFVIFLLVFSVYWPVTRFDFVAFDDMMYVTENHHVQDGLTANALRWAFKPQESEFSSYWQPLTWLSHMLDIQLYGLRAGGHHLTSLLVHLLNAILVYLILIFSTGRGWPAFIVSLLFALHPVNVETVAWISARKNGLSTFCWLLAMLAYIGYARRQNLAGYMVTLLCFVAGLMVKPMLITLPFVFLLMDFWPLERFGTGRPKRFAPDGNRLIFRLLLEKIPFFLLSAGLIFLSMYLLDVYQTYVSLDSVPLKLRILNAWTSYIRYVVKMVWPVGLAVYYPFPAEISLWRAGGAAVIILAISVWAAGTAVKRPYVFFGWFWYLGTLVPVIGLVQAGLWPAMADRWAYVPLIGLFVAIVWGAAELTDRWRCKKIVRGAVALLLVTMLSIQSGRQLQHWRNSETLFKHAIDVTEDNAAMTNNLANVMFDQGRTDEAIRHYRRAIEIKPDFAEAHHNYGVALIDSGQYEQAAEQLREAVHLDPQNAQAYNSLGSAMLSQGKNEKAVSLFRRALVLDPTHADAHNNLGLAYVRNGSLDRAITHFRASVGRNRDRPAAQRNLNRSLQIKARLDPPMASLTDLLAKKPESPGLSHILKQMNAEKARLDRGLAYYRKSLSVQPGFTADELKTGNYPGLSQVVNGYQRFYPLYDQISKLVSGGPEFCYYVACVYAARNAGVDAVAWLEKALAAGFKDYSLVRNDKNLDNVRNMPGFWRLVSQFDN